MASFEYTREERIASKLEQFQCITFAETFYWCYLSAPQILAYPFPHGYSTGVLTSLIPYNIQGVCLCSPPYG